MARAHLVDLSVTRWYLCVARCVRGASLLAEGPIDRKQWIERRLEELAEIFSISVAAFAVLDDRVHLVARLDPEVAQRWSKGEVVRRFGSLVPPRNKGREPLPVSDEWVRARVRDTAGVETARQRLQSLGWFMKSLKEPLARIANRQEKTRGAFFESRFKSIAILDDESLLATCVYVDLSPLVAGSAPVSEALAHTSLHLRLKDIQGPRRSAKAKRPKAQAADRLTRSSGVESPHWLCPIERRRGSGSPREGMLVGLSLDDYVRLVKYTSAAWVGEEATISTDVTALFDRLGISAETWDARLAKLSDGRLLGRFFAASRERLRELAGELGVRHLDNLASCPTR
jgi:hypothetical protein